MENQLTEEQQTGQQITLPATTNSITYIAVKHNNPDVVWITYGGYDGERIFESTNGGTSWTNISAGLPNIPANVRRSV